MIDHDTIHQNHLQNIRYGEREPSRLARQGWRRPIQGIFDVNASAIRFYTPDPIRECQSQL